MVMRGHSLYHAMRIPSIQWEERKRDHVENNSSTDLI